MFQLERQVLRTYTTWRWMWLLLPIALLLMLGPIFSHRNDTEAITYSLTTMFGTVIPIMTCMPIFMAIAKWQFADPRARLIPGYRRPHVAVIFVVLAVLLVANPLLQAFCQSMSPLGLLAFSLLLGGLFLHAMHSQRGVYVLPMMAIYMSSFYPTTARFWLSATGDFQAIHIAIILVGAALVGWSLWQLATLCEEDDGYFIAGFGSSRLERVLLGRLKDRKIARGGLGYRFSDRWHDRLTSLKNPRQAALMQWGWLRFSHAQQAIAVGLTTTLYGLSLGYLGLWIQGESTISSSVIVSILSFGLPALGAAILLRSRHPRMASELLHPASRTVYFNGLIQSLAKLTLYFWLAMSAGLWVVSMASPLIFEGNFTQMAVGYLLLSLAVQLPALALSLRMARWRSTVLFGLGCYGLATLELGLLAFWTTFQKEAGPILTAAFAAVLLIAVGVPLLIGARNTWLRAELG